MENFIAIYKSQEIPEKHDRTSDTLVLYQIDFAVLKLNPHSVARLDRLDECLVMVSKGKVITHQQIIHLIEQAVNAVGGKRTTGVGPRTHNECEVGKILSRLLK